MIYIVLTIILMSLLLLLFFITYVINKKVPVPKGCEDIVVDNEKCMSCGNILCRFSNDKEEEKE